MKKEYFFIDLKKQQHFIHLSSYINIPETCQYIDHIKRITFMNIEVLPVVLNKNNLKILILSFILILFFEKGMFFYCLQNKNKQIKLHFFFHLYG